MERTKEVSLEINNLFGAETEIPAVEKEIEAEPAASEETEEETSQSKAPEEEPEASPPEALVEPMDDFLDDEAPAEEEEEEEEAPDQEEGSEEAEEEEYNFGWVDELDIDEDYKKIIKGGPLRSAIRQARDGTLTEAMPKLSTLRAKAKGMVPSKFSFLAKTLDKFEIGEYKPKTLLKALKRKDPKYVIALNLIPKGELEGYLKNWVGLKLRIQPKDIQTLAGWKKYTAYLDKQKDLLGLPKEAPAQAIKLLYNFLKTNKEDIKFKEGFYPGAADPYDIKDIKYDENKDEITLFFGSVDEPVRINRTAFGVGRLIDAKDDSLQEQITKLLTPMIREQIRGKNG